MKLKLFSAFILLVVFAIFFYKKNTVSFTLQEKILLTFDADQYPESHSQVFSTIQDTVNQDSMRHYTRIFRDIQDTVIGDKNIKHYIKVLSTFDFENYDYILSYNREISGMNYNWHYTFFGDVCSTCDLFKFSCVIPVQYDFFDNHTKVTCFYWYKINDNKHKYREECE